MISGKLDFLKNVERIPAGFEFSLVGRSKEYSKQYQDTIEYFVGRSSFTQTHIFIQQLPRFFRGTDVWALFVCHTFLILDKNFRPQNERSMLRGFMHFEIGYHALHGHFLRGSLGAR